MNYPQPYQKERNKRIIKRLEMSYSDKELLREFVIDIRLIHSLRSQCKNIRCRRCGEIITKTKSEQFCNSRCKTIFYKGKTLGGKLKLASYQYKFNPTMYSQKINV